MNRSIAILAAGFLLASLLLAGATAPAAGASSDLDVGNMTVEELREGGEQPSDAPPSLRWLGRSSALYIDYEHTNPLRGGGGEDWEVQQLLRPGALVNTDKLRFHLQGVRSAGNTTHTVHVVYWNDVNRKYETESGETVTREEAVNVTHETKTITFAGPWDTSSIDLRSHYDDTQKVTMWIDGYEDSARWTFNHQTLETSQTVSGINTAGDLAWWAITELVIWILVFGIIAAALAMWAIRRAGAGPQMGFAVWTLLIGFVGFLALLFGYNSIAETVSRAPKVLAFMTVGLLTVPLLEGQDDRVKKILAIQPNVTDATLASGEEAVDALSLKMKKLQVTERDGETIRIAGGPLKFLARLLGGYAPIGEAQSKLQTRVDADGDTKYKEVVWIDHHADEIEHYRPEGFDINVPTTLRGAVWLLGVIAAAGFVLYGLAGSSWTWLAVFAGLPVIMSVRKGEADLEPAPVHSRAAHMTAMQMSNEFKDAETLEESLKETYKERAKSSQEVEERVELRDATVLQEMLGVDVSASMSGSERPIEPDGGDLDDE